MREIKYRAFGNRGRRKGKWYFGTSQIEKYKGTDNQGGDNQMNKSRIGKLTKNQRRILRCRAFIMVQNSKARRRYKFPIAFCDLMIHITKVNEVQVNRGVTVTSGFGFDANGNPRTTRLS